MKTLLFFSLMMLNMYCHGQEAIKVKQISDQGQPLIFLPHIGCSSEMWTEVAQEYKQKFSVYLVDFAGFNGLQPLAGRFTEAYVQAIKDLVKSNDLKNPVFVGQNYGAFIGAQVAADPQMSVKALIAVDFYPNLSLVLDPDMTAEKLAQVLAGMRMGMMQADAGTFKTHQKQTAEMMNFSDPKNVDRFVEWQVRSDRHTLTETLCEQFETDLRPMLMDNKVPILALSTWYFAKTYKKMSVDEAPGYLDKMYKPIPLVTHAITEKAKDFMANDQPEWVVQQMNAFLKI